MANEAVPVEGPYLTRDFTVASNTAIDKGTVCIISGDRTAAICATTGAFAGIAVSDKSVSDSDVSTELGLARTGIFDMYCGGGSTIAAGAAVVLSGVNTIEGPADEAAMVAGQVVGVALEATAVGTAETIEVDIGRTS